MSFAQLMPEFFKNEYSNDDIYIRHIYESDLPELEWGGEYLHYRRLYSEIFSNVQKGIAIMWVVELKNNGLVGQLFVQLHSPRPELANGVDRAYFYAFRVKEDYRRHGIGSRLIEFAENDLRERSYRKITLNVGKDNTEAIKFYKKHGFKIVAPEPGRWFYLDHLGKRRDVHEPSWRLEKSIH